jgi:hypothetical protein
MHILYYTIIISLSFSLSLLEKHDSILSYIRITTTYFLLASRMQFVTDLSLTLPQQQKEMIGRQARMYATDSLFVSLMQHWFVRSFVLRN